MIQLDRDKYEYLDSHESIRLESVGVLGNFLDNLGLVQGLDCHLIIFNKDSYSHSSFILLYLVILNNQ